MSQYINYLNLARQHNILAFTALQEEAFRSEYISDSRKNLFVIGETSSGKTLIPLLLYERAVLVAQRLEAPCPKMLFVVPYRALAAQKKLELDQFFENYDLNIVQSTGEFREHDLDIQFGHVDIAVMITEKVFNFQAREGAFLTKYDLLVLDEVGLIDNAERGIYFDFLFVWGVNTHRETKKLRMIALGTPFYNWDIYIKYYNFYPIFTSAERSVPLENNMIFFNKNGISQVEGDCDIIHRTTIWKASKLKKIESVYDQALKKCSDFDFLCPVRVPCRSDRSLSCGKIKGPCTSPVMILPEGINVHRYILQQICRHHLLEGHQVLIFVNNREEVINLSMFLYQSLSQLPELAEIFPPPPSVEACRKAVLEECGLNSDDVYGILEYEDGSEIKKECYQAFISGIAFHSAALPNELRTYIEMKLLASREMKIVCSTETLAFGINSSVDVVVIASLTKQEDGFVRMLTMNEYYNYIGRAGRLCVGVDISQLKGIVYTLVRDSQKEDWDKIRSGPLPHLNSTFYNDADEKMPFFLLNLIQDNTKDGIRLCQFFEIAMMMPRDSANTDEELKRYVKNAVSFLTSHGLLEKISKPVPRGRGKKTADAVYYLTKLGSRLRGYILEKSDYEKLENSVNDYVNSVYLEPDKITFIYQLLCTKHASSALKGVFENSNLKVSFETLCNFILSRGTECAVDWPPIWLTKSNEKNIFVLAAVLAWCDGESIKSIYNRYGVQYALISKFSQQISYLVEVAKELIPVSMDLKRQEFMKKWASMAGKNQLSIMRWMEDESFIKQCDEKIIGAERLAVSLYFGINTMIHKEIVDYLEQIGEESSELVARYALNSLSPVTAREFRKIILAYMFFERDMPQKWESQEERNDYMSLRRQRYLEVKKIDPLIIRFFVSKFGSVFTDKID